MPVTMQNTILTDPSTENYYWGSRLIAALADPHFPQCVQMIDRYQEAVASKGREIVKEYDRKIAETGDLKLAAEANEKLCTMAREETTAVLNKVLLEATSLLKNGFNRADH